MNLDFTNLLVNCTITRVVNKKIRYLNIKLLDTLFNDMYLVLQIYGSQQNRKPTGVIKKIFTTKSQALQYITNYINKKYKKGYR